MLLVTGPRYVDLKREPDELPDDQPSARATAPRTGATLSCRYDGAVSASRHTSPPEEVEENL